MKGRHTHVFSLILFKLSRIRFSCCKLIELLLIFLLLGSTGAEAKTYLITVVAEGGLFDIGQRFLEEAYERVGLKVQFINMPAERALVNSNAGIVDGEIFRVDNIHKEYSNLLKVPTSFIHAENVAFTQTLKIHIDDYESLRAYHIGFRRGLKVLENNMKGFPWLYPVTETRQAFLMLNRGRLDVVIEERLTGLNYVNKMNLKGVHILEGPVNSVPLYHYLHKKNKDLIPKLDAAFQAMNQEKILDKIIKKYEVRSN